ncbi:hypothetical protein [Mucilaginibacter pedocola]|nr:hypothetical protein [Mucilaginibacter pedocola]
MGNQNSKALTIPGRGLLTQCAVPHEQGGSGDLLLEGIIDQQ